MYSLSTVSSAGAAAALACLRRAVRMRASSSMVPKGFSAAVYTQTTDVEGEVNGLMTYDRKVIKINEAEVRKANQEVIKALSE